jgi:hypothetical protein
MKRHSTVECNDVGKVLDFVSTRFSKLLKRTIYGKNLCLFCSTKVLACVKFSEYKGKNHTYLGRNIYAS